MYLEKPTDHFWSIMGFTCNGCAVNCVFCFLMVKGGSNPLTTPGSDIP